MKMAKEKNVSVGSHPGFYDLHGFGRRKLNLNLSEIERLTFGRKLSPNFFKRIFSNVIKKI